MPYKFCHMEKIQIRLRENVKLLSCHLNFGVRTIHEKYFKIEMP